MDENKSLKIRISRQRKELRLVNKAIVESHKSFQELYRNYSQNKQDYERLLKHKEPFRYKIKYWFNSKWRWRLRMIFTPYSALYKGIYEKGFRDGIDFVKKMKGDE